mmetsp:Transcript_11964/g.24663  ORF Transcript_11964/g.24663 Transcript_11964/m.24663 type:complete len:281 (+) Transcript_11964:335-1177(+)
MRRTTTKVLQTTKCKSMTKKHGWIKSKLLLTNPRQKKPKRYPKQVLPKIPRQNELMWQNQPPRTESPLCRRKRCLRLLRDTLLCDKNLPHPFSPRWYMVHPQKIESTFGKVIACSSEVLPCFSVLMMTCLTTVTMKNTLTVIAMVKLMKMMMTATTARTQAIRKIRLKNPKSRIFQNWIRSASTRLVSLNKCPSHPKPSKSQHGIWALPMSNYRRRCTLWTICQPLSTTNTVDPSGTLLCMVEAMKYCTNFALIFVHPPFPGRAWVLLYLISDLCTWQAD